MTPLIFILSLLSLGIILVPAYIPDSYEYGLMSSCMNGSSQSIDCQNSEWTFRPPFAAFFGMVFFWVDPFTAIAIASLVSLSLGISAVAKILKPMGNVAAVGGAATVLLAFLFSRYPLLADARIVCIGPLFWAWALCVDKQNQGRINLHALGAGLLMGAAALTRPECQLTVIFLILFFMIRNRSSALWATAGAAIPVGGWLMVLSVRAGTIVSGPRHWEGLLLSLWEHVPRRWTLQTYGMGMWSPPARINAIEESTMVNAEVQGPSLVDGLKWNFQIISEDPFLWIVFVLGLLWCASQRRFRDIALISMFTIATNLVAACWPQARDATFPSSNHTLTKLMLWALSGAATLAFIVEWFKNSKRTQNLNFVTATLCICLVSFGLSLQSPETSAPRNIETMPHGQSAINWLKKNTRGDAHIISSYESAPLVWLSRRKWQQTPAPWDSKTKVSHLVVSDLDPNWLPNEVLKPVAFFGEDHNWITIYAMDSK